ncbi:sodium symporter [Salinadaptatus halalkaliphilus]|uniref:Sodium symporter n=1 Tax=Salinadaptatus halalkaliphilus TaxID=2419781 RepID=A0A4V6RUD6_9EURY|nr:sodium symporter [Salinadaptatus halalkaliphilus]THE65257.1 sodium symporter [Salinadaptatus halalkaliphilus]
MDAIPVETVVDVTTTIFVLSTMLAMGLELSLEQLLAPLKRRRLLAKSLLVNLLVVPMVAYLLVRAVTVEPGYAVGILLLAVAPGAPFGPKLAEISDSDIAFASGLMAILGIVSVATIPLSLAVFLPGEVAVDPVAIGQLVFVIQLVPLVAGLALVSRLPGVADRLFPPAQRLSDATFVFLLALLSIVYLEDMIALVGTGTLFVASVVVAVSLLCGYVLGGPTRTTREVLATTTAARNAAIALFIATTSFTDPNVLTVVLAFSFIGVVASVLLAAVWRRRTLC